MTDRFAIAHIDEEVARDVFGRNVLNSQRVIRGEFENALVDIIVQLESPPHNDGAPLPVIDLTKRIARGLRQGFAGLPPNGLEFCSWLWDAAPLHYVAIPQANEYGAARGFQYGVLHLRKVACMVLGFYVDEQPQLASQLVPMLDSSVDWVDARTCITNVFLSHYMKYFDEAYEELRGIAAQPAIWRKLLPIGVAARMLAFDADSTAQALALLPPVFEAVGDENVYAGIAYALRSAAMYGNHDSFADFIRSIAPITHPELRRVLCETFARPRMHWSSTLRREAKDLIRPWKGTGSAQLEKGIDAALISLGSAIAR